MQLNRGKFECNASIHWYWHSSKLNLFTDQIINILNEVPIVRQTPIHYLYSTSPMNAPSPSPSSPPLSLSRELVGKLSLRLWRSFHTPCSATLSCIYTRHEKFPPETLPTNFKCSGDGGASQSWPASRQIAAMHPETRRFREVARKQVAPMSLKRSIENPSLPIILLSFLPSFLPSFLNSTLNYRRFYFRDYEPLWFQRIAYLY